MRLGNLLALTTLVASNALAQMPSDPGVVDLTTGKPLTVSFTDGRVATLRLTSVTAPKYLQIPFQIYENDCTEAKGMRCVYKTSYREYWAQMVWTKHSDPAKVGETVIKTGYMNKTPFESTFQVFGPEAEFMPILAKGMPRTQIECADFSWLPSATTNAPARLDVTRWETENMTENPDTGMAENRTSFGGFDVELVQTSPSALAIEKVGAFTNANGFSAAVFMVGDVSSMTLTKADGQQCQVAMKPGGLADVTSNIGNVQKMRPSAKSAPDFLNGENELSAVFEKRESPFLGNLKYFLEYLPKSAEVE